VAMPISEGANVRSSIFSSIAFESQAA
jgi:hypothetical protein